MFTYPFFSCGFFWLFPVIMIAMMAFCFVMMRKMHHGSQGGVMGAMKNMPCCTPGAGKKTERREK